MKKSVVIAFVLSLLIISLHAQVVEVIGKLKVTQMDTLNGETMLVVKNLMVHWLHVCHPHCHQHLTPCAPCKVICY